MYESIAAPASQYSRFRQQMSLAYLGLAPAPPLTSIATVSRIANFLHPTNHNLIESNPQRRPLCDNLTAINTVANRFRVR